MSDKPVKLPPKNNAKSNTSNTIRGIIFAAVMIFFCVLIANNLNTNNQAKAEVPLSDVVMRLNSDEHNIKKITVTGSTLEITLKDKDYPTEISRKDASGTLYDQGLIDKCADLEGDELVKCQEKQPIMVGQKKEILYRILAQW